MNKQLKQRESSLPDDIMELEILKLCFESKNFEDNDRNLTCNGIDAEWAMKYRELKLHQHLFPRPFVMTMVLVSNCHVGVIHKLSASG